MRAERFAGDGAENRRGPFEHNAHRHRHLQHADRRIENQIVQVIEREVDLPSRSASLDQKECRGQSQYVHEPIPADSHRAESDQDRIDMGIGNHRSPHPTLREKGLSRQAQGGRVGIEKVHWRGGVCRTGQAVR